jgi:putative exporter of polyketide antibiotics
MHHKYLIILSLVCAAVLMMVAFFVLASRRDIDFKIKKEEDCKSLAQKVGDECKMWNNESCMKGTLQQTDKGLTCVHRRDVPALVLLILAGLLLLVGIVLVFVAKRE